MPQSLVKNLMHLVFATKHRRPFIIDSVRDHLHQYLAGIFQSLDCPALKINSVPDHIHILFNLHRTHALADIVMETKRGSSKWMKTQHASLREFEWQKGYGAFSVSQSNVDAVKIYIANQAEHHRVKIFQEEYLALVERYQIPFVEKYLWD